MVSEGDLGTGLHQREIKDCSSFIPDLDVKKSSMRTCSRKYHGESARMKLLRQKC